MRFFSLNIIHAHIPVACVLLSLLLLSGCGKREDVQYDNTRAQILRRLFGNLTRGESDQALRDVERLRTLTGSSPFYRQVKEHERIRKQLLKAVQAIRTGHSGEVLPILQRLNQQFPGTDSVQNALLNCRALNALQNTVRDLPASWAEQQQAALANLNPYRDTLAAIPAFQKWHEKQQKRLTKMKQREHAEARRQLRSELDFALVSRRATAPFVLAQLAAVNTDIRTALENQARHSLPSSTPDTTIPLETALCLLGDGNPANTSESNSPRARTAWRSQQLLKALVSARRGHWSPAFRQLSEIHLELPLDRHYSTMMLISFPTEDTSGERLTQTPPCPSVSEVLQRIVDVAK